MEQDKITFKLIREKSNLRGEEWHNMVFTKENKLDDLLFRSNELAGEVGEACNEVKKISRGLKGMKGSKDMDEGVQHLAEELADVIICVDRVADVFDIDLSDAVRNKFNKTSKKYNLSVTID